MEISRHFRRDRTLGPRKAGLARPNYTKASVLNCRYLSLLILRRNASAHLAYDADSEKVPGGAAFGCGSDVLERFVAAAINPRCFAVGTHFAGTVFATGGGKADETAAVGCDFGGALSRGGGFTTKAGQPLSEAARAAVGKTFGAANEGTRSNIRRTL